MALLHGETPKHLAESIILKETRHVPNTRGWRKREVKIKRSRGYQSLDCGIKTPCILAAPILSNRRVEARVLAQRKIRPANPAAYERERPKMIGGLYSRVQFEADIKMWEDARATLRRNFLAGNGPYTDGLRFKAKDDQFLAEIRACEQRLGATQGVIQQSRKLKAMALPTIKQNTSKGWMPIGNNEAIAMRFKQNGYKIRKIEAGKTKDYQVLMTRR